MNLQADIKWIVKELQGVQGPDFIKAIKSLLQYRAKKQPEGIGIEQYNREIEEAEKDIEAGNFYTLQEVKKIAGQWGRK